MRTKVEDSKVGTEHSRVVGTAATIAMVVDNSRVGMVAMTTMEVAANKVDKVADKKSMADKVAAKRSMANREAAMVDSQAETTMADSRVEVAVAMAEGLTSMRAQ